MQVQNTLCGPAAHFTLERLAHTLRQEDTRMRSTAMPRLAVSQLYSVPDLPGFAPHNLFSLLA
jgi:hypothetical protein